MLMFKHINRLAAFSCVALIASPILPISAQDDLSLLDETVVSASPEPRPVARTRGAAPVTNRVQNIEAPVDFAAPVESAPLERPRIDNPISVAQFSGDDLLLRGVSTQRGELFRRTANATNLPGGLGSFTIRGLNDDAISSPTLDTGSSNLATVFINQAPVSKNYVAYTSPTLWDVKQVEILRGPQSVFQGPNSIAGAVFFDYNNPGFEWEGRSRLEYGEYDTINWAIMQNIPLVDDYLAARFTYERYLSDGYVTNITRNEDDWGNTDRQFAKIQLLYRPTGDDDNTLNFTYRFGRDRGNDVFPDHGTTTPLFDRTSTFDNDDVRDSDTHFVSLEGKFTLNDDWQLETVTSAQSVNLIQDFDADYTPSPFFRSRIGAYVDEEFYSQEIRSSFDNGGPLRATLGLYGQYSDYKNGLNGFAFGSPVVTNVSEIGVVGAVFANAEYDLTDKLTLGAGARLNYEERDVRIDALTAPAGFPAFTFTGQGAATESFTDLLPEVNLSYRLDDQQTVGGLVSRGYRSGGVSVAPFFAVARSYEPEYTWNYELFYRGVFNDGRTRINSNLFYADWTDQQVPVQLPFGSPFDVLVQNVGESTMYGFELEFEQDLTSEWSVFAALGYTKTEFGNFPVNATTNLAGRGFPYAPEWNTSLGLQYVGDSGVFGSVNWSYVSGSYSDPGAASQTPLDGRSLVDAKIGYGQDGWKVYLFGSNLFDEEYASRLSIGSSFPGVNPAFGLTGPPRMVGVGVEVAW